ncbi:hypothetical protein ACYOEI_21300 [Singulisphaera rosea]
MALFSLLVPELRAEVPNPEPAENPRPNLPDGPSRLVLPGNRISRTDRPIAADVSATPPKLVVPPSNAAALRAVRAKAQGTTAKNVEFPNADASLIATIRAQIKADVKTGIESVIEKHFVDAGDFAKTPLKVSTKDEITVILCPVHFAAPSGGKALLKPGEIRVVTPKLFILGTEPKAKEVIPTIETAHLFLGGHHIDEKGKLAVDPEHPPDVTWTAFRNAWGDAGELAYSFNGETNRVTPQEEHWKHPLKSDEQLPHPFGLVKIRTQGEEKACCHLVPQGYYDFVPSETGAWDLAPSTFPFRIDNTKNPNHFAYSLGGEPNLVPARQVDIVVARYPRLKLSFRSSEIGAKHTERWVEAGTLKVQVAEVGEFLVVTDAKTAVVDQNELNESLDQLIFTNPTSGRTPVSYDIISDPADYDSFTRRFLGPGDTELHRLSGNQYFIVRFSAGEPFGAKYRWVQAGSYQFVQQPGIGWELYRRPPYSVGISNDTDATIAFSCDEAYAIIAGDTRTLKSKRPITIFFDRGDGQGLARKALPTERFGKTVARYRFVYDPTTSLFEVLPVIAE